MHTVTTQGFILNKMPSGEYGVCYTLVTQEHGILICFKRRAKKPSGKGQLDLFDKIEVRLDSPSEKSPFFIKEYLLVERYKALGKSYTALICASQFARLLAKNKTECKLAYPLFEKALKAWSYGHEAEAVLFKSLYLFAKQEGYPVKEQWLAKLSKIYQEKALTVLNQSLEKYEDKGSLESLITPLLQWIEHHTDILV